MVGRNGGSIAFHFSRLEWLAGTEEAVCRQFLEVSKAAPSRKRKWDGALRGFLPSRIGVSQEGGCKMSQEVMKARKFFHRGFFCMVVEFKTSQSSYPWQVTGWNVW